MEVIVGSRDGLASVIMYESGLRVDRKMMMMESVVEQLLGYGSGASQMIDEVESESGWKPGAYAYH